MNDVSKRFGELSPQRRRLLEQLLKAQSGAASEDSAVFAPAPGTEQQASAPAARTELASDDGLRLQYDASSAQMKQNFKSFYNEVSRQLDTTQFGAFSYFLNYGYAPDGSPESAAVALPDQYFNKNSVKLVLELIGDCDLTGRRILDVGCGRGGTVYTIKQFFEPAAIVGLDLSPNAVQFCCRAHRYPGVSFREGDAEQLPFADASFDVVANVESSHTYPNIRSFYIEVYRVLAAGGHFLYTDLLPREKSDECLGLLRHVGFIVESERDITNNVLLSCDQIAASRAQIFQTGNDAALVSNFLGAPGSQVYEEMKSRAWVYRLLRLRKPEPTS